MFTGDMRVSGLYRQQWAQFGNPFITGTLAFEIKPRGFKDGQNINRLAFGGMILYDQTPDAVLKSQHAYATIAYHKALDAEGKSRLGAGFMAGINQRTLDPTRLVFASQFQSGGFDPSRPGEAVNAVRASSFDVHAGLMYSYEDEFNLYYAGASLFHIMGPKDYFLAGDRLLEATPRRFNLNAGFNIRGENLRFAGSALFMSQQKVNTVMAGGMVGVPFGESGVVYGGAWYRVGESIIPTVNLQWSTFSVGLSYDTFLNTDKSLIRPQSFELSMSYRLVKYHDFKTGCFAF
jgi:type IX secretion system PorP/SprF family membrane protein